MTRKLIPGKNLIRALVPLLRFTHEKNVFSECGTVFNEHFSIVVRWMRELYAAAVRLGGQEHFVCCDIELGLALEKLSVSVS